MAAVLLPWAAAAQTARIDEPRAFGYSVGDVVTRHIELDVPAGLTLDAASVPQPGRRGKALELRSVALRQGRLIDLEYQVLLSPREMRVLEMPAFTLSFAGGQGGKTLRIDAWPVAVQPLVAVDAPSRTGLGDMRPDAAPMPIDISAGRARLIVYAVVAALLLGYLAHVYIGLPWWARHRRPFGVAWRALRGLPAQPGEQQRRDAWAQVHGALNQTAGEVVFEAGLDRFVARHARFKALRGDLQVFFERSRQAFFAGDAAPDDGQWLMQFLRKCRDAERGAA